MSTTTQQESHHIGRNLGRDVILTSIASVLVLVGNAVIASLLARRGIYDVFEPYNVAKRVGNVVYSVLTLGMTIGAVRYFAAAASDAERRRVNIAAIGMLAATVVAGTALMVLWPAGFSRLLVGEPDVALGWATWAFSVALALNAMVYAFYRAELRQTLANVANLVAVFVLPLAVILAAPPSWHAPSLLTITSLLIIVWSVWLLGRRLLESLADRDARSGVAEVGRQLLAFSAWRIPAGAGGSLILAIGPWVARSRGELDVSATLVAAMLVSQLAGAALQAFGIVLLPRVSKSAIHDGGAEAGRLANALMQAGLVLSICAIPPLLAAAASVVPLWLGGDLASAVPVVQVIAFSVPGVVLFSLLRSIADGAIEAPVNTYATIAGLAVTFAFAFMVDPADADLLAAGYVAGQSLMAVVLIAALQRRFGLAPHVGHLAGVIAAAVVVGAGVAAAQGAGVHPLLVTALAIIGFLVASLGGLWFSPARFGIRAGIARAIGYEGRLAS